MKQLKNSGLEGRSNSATSSLFLSSRATYLQRREKTLVVTAIQFF